MHPAFVCGVQSCQFFPEGEEGGVVGVAFLGEGRGGGVCGELLSVFSLPLLQGEFELDDAGLLLRDD
jgi:hypothetical protein